MTLRDYFAATALSAVIQVAKGPYTIGPNSPEQCAVFAGVSYALADAMLKARTA